MFFFKQKTAYKVPLRLVGSEMCIRDSYTTVQKRILAQTFLQSIVASVIDESQSENAVNQVKKILECTHNLSATQENDCILYTSDADDEHTRVDIGGRHTKRTNIHHEQHQTKKKK